MESLKIYRINTKYIRYLHGADNRVQYNKEACRPYVGIVLTVGSYRYFVPMESPKRNHKNLTPSIHIMPLDGGKYGQLGFNNMIPVHPSALIPFDIANEPDKQYAELLKRQASYINRHKADQIPKTYKQKMGERIALPYFFILRKHRPDPAQPEAALRPRSYPVPGPPRSLPCPSGLLW